MNNDSFELARLQRLTIDDVRDRSDIRIVIHEGDDPLSAVDHASECWPVSESGSRLGRSVGDGIEASSLHEKSCISIL